jgi:hypothetical protein
MDCVFHWLSNRAMQIHVRACSQSSLVGTFSHVAVRAMQHHPCINATSFVTCFCDINDPRWLEDREENGSL